jgi:hypothetical protein
MNLRVMLSWIACGFASPRLKKPPLLPTPASGPGRSGSPPIARVPKKTSVSTTSSTGAVHSSLRRTKRPMTPL